MRTVYRILGCGAGVLLALVMTATAQGQTRRAGVHRMEINNGATQTVRYYGQGISPGATAALRDLERSENELAYARNLQDLKREYVSNERQLEATRSLAQQELYGRSMAAGGYGVFGTFPGLDSNLLAAYNLGGYYGLGSFYGLGGVYSPALYPGLGYGRGYAGLLGTGLAYGVGTDDPIKDSLASVIAQQATPQYVASIERNMDRAVAQVGASPSIRDVLGPKTSRVETASAETDPVMVTLKDGTVLRGSKLDESSKEWVTIITSTGEKKRVRPSEVIRIDEPKPKVG